MSADLDDKCMTTFLIATTRPACYSTRTKLPSLRWHSNQVPLSESNTRTRARSTKLCRALSSRPDAGVASVEILTPAPPNPPKTWVDNLPLKIRPYLYLTRIDKPIGTLLLYYPCSMFPSYPCPSSLFSSFLILADA